MLHQILNHFYIGDVYGKQENHLVDSSRKVHLDKFEYPEISYFKINVDALMLYSYMTHVHSLGCL